MYHIHLAGSVSAILSSMTANQRPVSVKSFCFRHQTVPGGHTITAHVQLLSLVEAGTETVCHARRSILPRLLNGGFRSMS